MKKFLVKIVGGLVLPQLKKLALKYVEDEELQKKYTKMLNDKIDIPDVPEENEQKWLDASYDVAQVLIKENIEKIDIDKIVSLMD